MPTISIWTTAAGIATTYDAVTVADEEDNGSSAATSATVKNVAPSGVSMTAIPDPINENEMTTVSGSFSDPGSQDSHTVVIDWGDGSTDTMLSLDIGVLTFSAGHQYWDNRPGDVPYAISATVTDKDGDSGDGSTSVTVQNVAPANVTVSASPDTINENDTTFVLGSFTDVGMDTHTVVITCDGRP